MLKDRSCLKSSGKFGMGIEEWVGEVQAWMWICCLSQVDQAFFLLDYFGGDAWEKIQYCSDLGCGNLEPIISALRESCCCTQLDVFLLEKVK